MISKRHLKRIIKCEKEKAVKRMVEGGIANLNNTTQSDNTEICASHDSAQNEPEEVETVADNKSLKEESGNLSISQKLIKWNAKHRPSRNCVKDLIQILREENIVVTPFYKFDCSDRPIVEDVAGGSYIHIGMPRNLKRIADVIKLPDDIIIDVNVDGLPLFKSSKVQLWPILIRLTNVEERPIFPVGVFVGRSKPATCEEFLSKFVEEISSYLETGLQLEGNIYRMQIRAVLCDAPARSFISGTPSHASRHGCSKCTQIARKCDGT